MAAGLVQLAGASRRWLRPDAPRGGREMGESDLLLGPHGEEQQQHRGIGIMGIRPRPPYGRHAPWPWRTHKITSPVTSHTQRRAARRRRTDQSLAPSSLADEQAPQSSEAQGVSPPCLFWRLSPLQPRCCERCAGSRTWPANMHARGRQSQRSSNRLDPSDGCCCRKEHSKKVRLIRPGQSEAEQGDQRNYGELPVLWRPIPALPFSVSTR